MPNIAAYEHTLLEYATEGLRTVRAAARRDRAAQASVLSFVLDGYSPPEVGTALDREASRSGPVTTAPNRSASVRAGGDGPPVPGVLQHLPEVDALVTARTGYRSGRLPG